MNIEKIARQKQATHSPFWLMVSLLFMAGILFSNLGTAHAAGFNADLEQKAENGNTQAQFDLGTLYLNAQGPNRDVNKALQWLTYAANNQHSEAQQTLGLLYFHGWHTSESTLSAKYWFEQAAKNGVSEAGYYLQKPEFSTFTTMSNSGNPNALHISIYGKVTPAH